MAAQIQGYNNGGQAVQETAISSEKSTAVAPIEAFGGGAANTVAGAVGRVADTAATINDIEQRKAQELVNKEIQQKIDSNHVEQYGPNGVFNSKGKDAFTEAPERLQKNNQDLQSQLTKDYPNQTAYINHAMDKYQNTTGMAMAHHSNQQRDQYDKNLTDAQIDSNTSLAQLHYNDPQQVNQDLGKAVFAYDTYAQGKLPQAEIDFQKQKIISRGLSNVVTAKLAADDVGGAKAYFDAHNDAGNFTGPDSHTLTENLKGAVDRQKAQNISDDIIKNSNDEYAAFQKANEAPTAIRESVVERVKSGMAMKTKISQSPFDQNFGEALQTMTSTQGQTMTSSQRIDQIPLQKLQSLQPDELNAMKLRAKIMSGEAQPDSKSKDYFIYSHMTMADMGRVTEKDIALDTMNMPVNQQKEVISQWQLSRKGINGDTAARDQFKSIFSDKELTLNALKSIPSSGISGNDTPSTIVKDPTKEAIAMQFNEQVDTAFQAFTHQTGKNPNDDQKKDIINGMLKKQVLVNGGWFSSNKTKPISMLTQSEAEDVKVEPNVVNQLIQVAKKNGVVPAGMSNEDAAKKLDDKIKQSNAKLLMGGSLNDVMEIMKGK